MSVDNNVALTFSVHEDNDHIDHKDETIKHLEEKIAEQAGRILMHEQEFSKIEGAHQKLWKDHLDLKENYAIQEIKINDLNDEVAETKDQVATANIVHASLREAMTEQEHEKALLEEKVRLLETRCELQRELIQEKDERHQDLKDKIQDQQQDIQRKNLEIDKTLDLNDFYQECHDVNIKIHEAALDKNISKSDKVSLLRQALNSLNTDQIRSARNNRNFPREIRNRCRDLLKWHADMGEDISRFERNNGHETVENITNRVSQFGTVAGIAGYAVAGPAALPIIAGGAVAVGGARMINSLLRGF